MAQPLAEAAVVNTIVDQLRTMTINDRMATFESAAHEVNTWLARFESTARGKGWTEAVLHTRLPMYLGDNEHEWYEGLDPATKDSYPRLRAAFVSEYTPNAASRFARETALRSFKQGPTTSVKDFLAHIRREARAIALPEDKGVEIALNNMLPAARASIAGNPTTYAEILSTPVARGEIPLPSTAEDNSQLLKKLLDAVTTLQANQAATVAKLDEHRHRPEPPTYHYNVNERPTPNPAVYRDPQPRPGPPQPRHQPRGPGDHPGRRQTPHQGYRPIYHQPPPRHQPGPAHPQQRRRPCRGCGGTCPERTGCPAQGSKCYSCGLKDHLDTCCEKFPHPGVKYE